MPTSKYFLFPAALGNGLTISKPYCAKGQGLERGFRNPPGWCVFEANLWHWSHFFVYSSASFCMFGHQQPWVMALWVRDLPPIWLPQIPSCNSTRSNSNASGCMHSRYGSKKNHLYNFWSSDRQNQGAFRSIFSASYLSYGKTFLLWNWMMGSIQLGPTLTWLT